MRRTRVVAVGLLPVLAVGTACAWDYLRPVDPPAVAGSADFILVEKAAHRLTVFNRGHAERVYQVALGRGGPGAKEVAGDDKVPEGTYRITGRNPASAFHLSLRIGYPTLSQTEAARRRHVDPGGDVMIHGIRRGLGWIGGWHRSVDWTRGCIAGSDAEIEQIWREVPDGATIVIKP